MKKEGGRKGREVRGRMMERRREREKKINREGERDRRQNGKGREVEENRMNEGQRRERRSGIRFLFSYSKIKGIEYTREKNRR